MRNPLSFKTREKSPDMEDDQALNQEIFAQLLAIFGTVNDNALETIKLRAEVRDLTAEVKALRLGLKEPYGDISKGEVRAIGAFVSSPDQMRV